MKTQGRRIETPPNSWEEGQQPMKPGDYWKDELGDWHGVTPNGLLVGLRKHKIQEHEDGIITVSPSILVTDTIIEWHGYLKNGIWEEC